MLSYLQESSKSDRSIRTQVFVSMLLLRQRDHDSGVAFLHLSLHRSLQRGVKGLFGESGHDFLVDIEDVFVELDGSQLFAGLSTKLFMNGETSERIERGIATNLMSESLKL